MPNKSSPHGGYICEGTVSHGTLRTQDLLRTFANELKRVLPSNGQRLAFEAHEMADLLDRDIKPQDTGEDAGYTLEALFDQLEEIARREGLTFGAHEGDGSDFGYWKTGDDE